MELGIQIKHCQKLVESLEEQPGKPRFGSHYEITSVRNALKKVQNGCFGVATSLIQKKPLDSQTVLSIANNLILPKKYQMEDLKKLNELLVKLEPFAKNVPEKGRKISIEVPKSLPQDIKNLVVADLKELKECYRAECFRASVILCGRVLEACLHRLYYDKTGFDILEKNPGIGLGTLIAKLSDKNITLDPGLSQQIHLINETRIFSVHKKKRAFMPSLSQTQAIILLTLDVIHKLYGSDKKNYLNEEIF